MQTKLLKRIISMIIAVSLFLASVGEVAARTVPLVAPTKNTVARIEGQTAEPVAQWTVTTAAGDSMSLLDTQMTDGTMQYFMISNTSLGSTCVASCDFDTNNSTGIAYALNTFPFQSDDYRLLWKNWSGNTSLEMNDISEDIKQHMAYHSYWTEAAPENGIAENYCTQSRLTLMSYSEFLTYYDRFGYLITGGNYWALRSARPDGKIMIVDNTSDVAKQGRIVGGSVTGNYKIRPIFYLDRDFFADVKLNISQTGASVLELIRNNYTGGELQRGKAKYSRSELEQIGYTANNVYSLDLPNNTGNIFDKSTFGFTVNADISLEEKFSIKCTSDGKDIYNEELYGASDETLSRFFGLSALDNGIHMITVEIMVDGEVKTSINKRVTVVSSHKSDATDNLSRVGVVQHMGQSNVQDDGRLSLMDMAGVKWARDLLLWWSYEPQKNTWDEAYADKTILGYSQTETKLHITLYKYNNLYNSDEEKNYSPYTQQQLEAFGRYVEKVVSKYPQIQEFEIWNEANRDSSWEQGADVVAYCRLVKEAARIIRRLRPDAKIIVGAVSNIRGMQVSANAKGDSKGDGERFLKELLAQDVYQYIDAISAHPYMYTNYSDAAYETRLSSYAKILDYCGGWKEIQASETGWPNDSENNISEQDTAERIVKAFVLGDRFNYDKIFIYEFVNGGTDEAERESNFGMINNDCNGKLPFVSLTNYLNVINGADYLGKTTDLNGNDEYVYHRYGMLISVLWSDVPYIRTLDFGESALDVYGNALTPINDGVNIGNSPVFIINSAEKASIEAVMQTVGEYLSAANECVNTDIVLPDISKMNTDEVNQFIDLLYTKAENIVLDRSIDFKTCILCADKLHKAATIMAAYCSWLCRGMESYTAVADNTIINTEKIVSSAEEDSLEASLPYTRAILRRAKKMSGDAQSLLASSQDDASKYSMAKEKDFIAEKLCALALTVCTREIKNYSNGFDIIPSETRITDYGQRTVSLSVKNHNDVSLATSLKVYDYNGDLCHTEKLSPIDADADAETAFTVEIPQTLPGGHYFYKIVLEDNTDVYAQQNIMVDLPSLGPLTSFIFTDAIDIAPAENVFTIDGQEFILLDSSGSGSSKYFIMSKGSVGKKAFATDGLQKFDAENPQNVCYYLNNTENLLPQSFYSHIDFNHDWLTEAGYLGGDCPNDYYTNCGVSLLSFNELLKYYKKIGLNDVAGKWMLRSTRGADSWSDVVLTVNPLRTGTSEEKMTNSIALRPVFYADEAFFDDVKVDSFGENVVNELNPVAMLASGAYDAQELEERGLSVPLQSVSVTDSTDTVEVNCTFKPDVKAIVYLAGYKDGTLVNIGIASEESPQCMIERFQLDKVKIFVLEDDSLRAMCKFIEY